LLDRVVNIGTVLARGLASPTVERKQTRSAAAGSHASDCNFDEQASDAQFRSLFFPALHHSCGFVAKDLLLKDAFIGPEKRNRNFSEPHLDGSSSGAGANIRMQSGVREQIKMVRGSVIYPNDSLRLF